MVARLPTSCGPVSGFLHKNIVGRGLHSQAGELVEYIGKGLNQAQPIKLDYSRFSVLYCTDRKVPLVVAECLQPEDIRLQRRGRGRFKADPEVCLDTQAGPEDYQGSGFDRGHQAAAANHVVDSGAYNESFYFTNICPQRPWANREVAYQIEQWCRSQALAAKKVTVYSGPLFLTEEPERIGPGGVAVPCRFFKVVMIEDQEGRLRKHAFEFPNAEGDVVGVRQDYESTLHRVSQLAKLRFSPKAVARNADEVEE